MALGTCLAALVAVGAAAGRPMDERSELLAKAMAAMKEAIPIAEKDANRPAYHFRPPAQWMNDPNGTIYYDGWYHVFYQLNPYGDRWDHMHWGHARSRDMVNWEHLPIALWPTKSREEDHIFSGSTFIDTAGRPKIFYTSISGRRAPEQWMATPDDADWLLWSKSDPNPVVSTKTHLPNDIQEWRDPFLFREDGKTYMLCGGRLQGKGAVPIYLAKNAELTEWEYKGILFSHPDKDDIECPNLAKIGDRWVLLTSEYGKVEYFVGKLDLKKPSFTMEKRGVLGEGSYATQLLRDKDGKLVHWAWNRFEGNTGWNGCLTLPNELTLAPDGTLLCQPAKSVETLRASDTMAKDAPIQGEMDLTPLVPGNSLEVDMEIDPASAKSLKVDLGPFGFTYDVATKTLSVPGRAPAVLTGKTLSVRLFLDRGVFDLYADGGRLFETDFKRDVPANPLFKITAEGGDAKLAEIHIHTMKPAEFDLSRFK